MALGFTQPLKEMIARKSFWGKTGPANRAGRFTAVCKGIVWKIWDLKHLKTL
jgi:hypothetical protein